MAPSIHIFGGGTVQYVRSHLALCAPAYGNTARQLKNALLTEGVEADQVALHLTRMADSASGLETNQDVALRLSAVLANPATKVVVFNVALCDFEGQVATTPSGKYAKRLKSRDGEVPLTLRPAPKLLADIKLVRPDVFVVGFKTTADDDADSQIALARRQLAETGVDLVWANDTVTRHNLLVTPNGLRVVAGFRARESLMAVLAELLAGKA